MHTFANLLRQNGFKATHQRLAILEAIEAAGHIDVDTLFKKLTSHFPSLAIGTLYRNLHELSAKQILTPLNVGENKTLYETTKTPHIHLVCQCCGAIEDQDIALMPLYREIEETYGFTIAGSALSFTGTCRRCRSYGAGS